MFRSRNSRRVFWRKRNAPLEEASKYNSCTKKPREYISGNSATKNATKISLNEPINVIDVME